MKTAVISGGAGGIGTEVCRVFAENGLFVCALDMDGAAGARLEAQLGSSQCRFLQTDVTNQASLEQSVKNLPVDTEVAHIVTLAGRALPSEWMPFEKQPAEELHASIALNLTAHLRVISAYSGRLSPNVDNKSITLISSINALGAFGLPAYSAAKAGLIGFVKSAARDFGARGVRVNAVSLGTVVTPATQREPKDFSALLKTTALNRFTTAREAAELVYLIAERLTALTGQNIVLDAGQSIAKGGE